MEKRELLNLLRHYRHQLLNDLQIVHGYLSMGMPEKSSNQVNALIERLVKERDLQAIDAPHFFYTFLSWRMQHPNWQVDYVVEEPVQQVSQFDEALTNDLQEVLGQIETFEDPIINVQIAFSPILTVEYQVANGESHQSEDVHMHWSFQYE